MCTSTSSTKDRFLCIPLTCQGRWTHQSSFRGIRVASLLHGPRFSVIFKHQLLCFHLYIYRAAILRKVTIKHNHAFEIDDEKDAGSTTPPAEKPPIAEIAAEMGLEGRVRQGKVVQRIDLIKRSQRDDVKKAWDKLASSHRLEKDVLEKAMLRLVLVRDYNFVKSMSRARKLGWTGYLSINPLLLISWALNHAVA